MGRNLVGKRETIQLWRGLGKRRGRQGKEKGAETLQLGPHFQGHRDEQVSREKLCVELGAKKPGIEPFVPIDRKSVV